MAATIQFIIFLSYRLNVNFNAPDYSPTFVVWVWNLVFRPKEITQTVGAQKKDTDGKRQNLKGMEGRKKLLMHNEGLHDL
jgi:hypothetical protein